MPRIRETNSPLEKVTPSLLASQRRGEERKNKRRSKYNDAVGDAFVLAFHSTDSVISDGMRTRREEQEDSSEIMFFQIYGSERARGARRWKLN